MPISSVDGYDILSVESNRPFPKIPQSNFMSRSTAFILNEILEERCVFSKQQTFLTPHQQVFSDPIYPFNICYKFYLPV